MEELTDLRALLHSKRANIFYIEKCRVHVKHGRVVYLTEGPKNYSYWNIPVANTMVLLLGIGTSISHAAVRMLASAGVLIGFCGNGGSPLFTGLNVDWMLPQGEYRPTEYMQKWYRLWENEESRLEAAKQFQKIRHEFILSVWGKYKRFANHQLIDRLACERSLIDTSDIDCASSVERLLAIEGRNTKLLYKIASSTFYVEEFTRNHSGRDRANQYLNHGNYLAYGLAATSLWVLGIPHCFPVMHGKTRRGALVFDIADLVKDALILPEAFLSTYENERTAVFRENCINNLIQQDALNVMINSIKTVLGY